MTNLEYLEKIKKINEEYDNGTYEIIFKKGSCLDYEEIMEQRKVRALEIIAETLISIYDRMCSEAGINVDTRIT
ncbi:unnamed protein product [marine sediment metagenome]|uniref:Uncharacterized protein n=1 Tax=marine sediment metagenome TaxID=412755 RepID=X0T191_9ZZZZ